jgi:competence protein ComEC
VIAVLLVANVIVYNALLARVEEQKLRVTFLDVGQGDAALVEFPDGKNLLIDAGPLTATSDAGSRFIGPFLTSHGIHRLDAIVMSHPDGDHIGGVPYLLRHFVVERVFDCGSYSHSHLSEDCLHLIDSLHIGRDIESSGKNVVGYENARLYILNPPGVLVMNDSTMHTSLNNQSLVLKLLYGHTSLLFIGDAEVRAEDRMIETYSNFLSANILKAGHHGSITSSSSEFLGIVHPQMAIISVGKNNKFGHPSEVILNRLKEIRCAYIRTDERGAVVIETDGTNWNIVNWL